MEYQQMNSLPPSIITKLSILSHSMATLLLYHDVSRMLYSYAVTVL
jgi:hypothetical protein